MDILTGSPWLLGQELHSPSQVWEKAVATHSSTLAWRIQGMGSGCSLWGHTESDTTEVT